MLLLLFSDQVAAAASGDAVTTMLVETAANTWYDATSDLISGNITRGRQNQLDQYQAGTCEVLLDNDDRKYDPTYASSPIYGYVLPMKRVQIKNTYNGTTYPLFTGYADRWTQNREGPHRGTTSLAASDGLKVLERARLASSAYAQEVVADGPLAWWRLGEPDGQGTAYDSSGNGYDATYLDSPNRGETGLVSRDAGTSTQFVNANANRVERVGNVITAFPFTVEAVVKVAASDTAFRVIFDNEFNSLPLNNAHYFVIDDNASGNQGKLTWVCSSPLRVVRTTQRVDDGLTHHVAVVATAGDDTRLYVDGVESTNVGTAGTAAFFTGTYRTGIGNTPAFSTTISPLALSGYAQEVAVYNKALSATRIAAHASAVATPWNGDLSGARVTRVLDAAGWPATDRNIDAGQTTLQSAELDMTALEHLQKVAATEFGNFYVTAAGTVRFEDRTSGVDQPVLYAFSDAAGAGLPVTFSNPEINDEQIRNDVTVSRLEGVAQNVKDSSSIGTYQMSSYVRDGLYNSSDDHSRYLAQFILDGYKVPVERVSSMAANPYNSPATLWPAVLAIELTDRITLAETPMWVTPAVTRTCVVEGIAHSFSAKTWSSSFNLSQNTTATQAYWQLGVAGYSELEQTTRLFF